MASGQVVRPEHCGPMALPPCITRTSTARTARNLSFAPHSRPRVQLHCPTPPPPPPPPPRTIRFADNLGVHADAFRVCRVRSRPWLVTRRTRERPLLGGPPRRAAPTTRKLADASISVNTRRAYLGALRRLDAWRGTAPVDDASLAVYLGALFEAGRAPATAALAVAAVRFRAKLAGQPAPAGEATARALNNPSAASYRARGCPVWRDRGSASLLAVGRRKAAPGTAQRRHR